MPTGARVRGGSRSVPGPASTTDMQNCNYIAFGTYRAGLTHGLSHILHRSRGAELTKVQAAHTHSLCATTATTEGDEPGDVSGGGGGGDSTGDGRAAGWLAFEAAAVSAVVVIATAAAEAAAA